HRFGAVEGRGFDIGLNAFGHLPQQVVAAVDVADAVHPHAIWNPTLTRGWSGRFPKPLQEPINPRRIGPRPLGLMLSGAHAPWSPRAPFHPTLWCAKTFTPPAKAQNGSAQRVPRSPS